MGSPNMNNAPKHARSMTRDKTCGKCGKKYAMDWARDNHQRECLIKINGN